MAFKEAARKAGPVILEPMMAVEVTTPEDFMGDMIGDLNSRRGQIQAMEERSGARVVKALVPLSEMFGYIRTSAAAPRNEPASMQFDSYAQVPSNVQVEIIAKARGDSRGSLKHRERIHRTDPRTPDGELQGRTQVAKAKFERTKPHVNIGTIGHIDHGRRP